MAKSKTYPAESYADDVVKGNIVVCEYVRLAVKRYFEDLRDAPEGGN